MKTPKKKTAENFIKDIRRNTRRIFRKTPEQSKTVLTDMVLPDAIYNSID